MGIDFTLADTGEAPTKKKQAGKKRKQIRTAQHSTNPCSTPEPRKKKLGPRSPGEEGDAMAASQPRSTAGERRGSPPGIQPGTMHTTAGNPNWSLTGVEQRRRSGGEGDVGRRRTSFIGHGFRGDGSGGRKFHHSRASPSEPPALRVAPRAAELDYYAEI